MGGVSGAQNSNGFVASISQTYRGPCCASLPDSSTLTYEGVFNEHFFQSGPSETEHACAATLFTVISEGQPWLAIWLKSCFDGAPRSSQPIELSVVIDVSGSMSWAMDSASGSQKLGNSRIVYARKAVEMLLNESLRPNDSIAISTFNTSGTPLQPLKKVSDLDKEQCIDAVRQLQPNGGTALSAGMEIGRAMFDKPRDEGSTRRIVFLTDMDDMNSAQLGEQIKRNSADGIYVSIVGMGVAFNSKLTDTVTKNKGSNYFCVTNEGQLQQCLQADFAFNFFPCAFEINLHIRAGSLIVSGVYGTPFDTKDRDDRDLRWTPKTDTLFPRETRARASELSQRIPSPLVSEVLSSLTPPKQSVTEINTLFPSQLRSDGAVKGGLILVKLNAVGVESLEGSYLQVVLDYEDLRGVAHTSTQDIRFPAKAHKYGTSDPAIQSGLHKGLMLQRYVQACRKRMDLVNHGPNSNEPMADGAVKSLTLHIEELELAGKGFKEEIASWKDQMGQLMNDDRMQTVATTFVSFAELYDSVVVDKKKDLVARVKWESERPQREAKIEEERRAWEAQQVERA